jgi:hypothetical protein
LFRDYILHKPESKYYWILKESAEKGAMRAPEKSKRERPAEILKLNGNWQAAITKFFQKKRPAGGWPKLAG